MHAARCRRGVVQIGAALIVAACSRPGASVLPAAVSEGDAVVLVRGPTSLTAGGVGDWHHATLDRAADGRALVVWQDGSGGAGFHTRWFAEDLQPRSPDVVTRDTGARVSHPQGLIVDGEGWVAWQAHDGAIRAQRVGLDGALYGAPVELQVEAERMDAAYPDLSATPGGGFVAHWLADPEGRPRYRYARYHDGEVHVEDLVSFGTFDVGGPGSIAAQPDGSVFMAWPENTRGWVQGAARIVLTRGPRGERTTVYEGAGRVDRAVVAVGDHGGVVGWVQYRYLGGKNAVVLRFMDVDGVMRGEPRLAVDAPADLIEVDATGDVIFVAWNEIEPKDRRLRVQAWRSSTGEPLGAPLDVARAEQVLQRAALRAWTAPDGAHALITWESRSDRDHSEIMAAEVRVP
jgi:hypothetical protein